MVAWIKKPLNDPPDGSYNVLPVPPMGLLIRGKNACISGYFNVAFYERVPGDA